MGDQLRKPFLFVALALLVLVVLVELASAKFVGPGGAAGAAASALDAPTPGFGIRYLALFDGLVLYAVVLMALSLLLPERIHGNLQGIVTLLVSLLWLIMSFLMILGAFVLLMLMVTLLVSPIFGTLAYLVIYADFDRGAAAATLGLLTLLKLASGACLLLAHQGFVKNKELVLMMVIALALNLLLGFLHALVPGFLVSITDMIGALVIAVVALVWAVVSLVESLISIVRVVA